MKNRPLHPQKTLRTFSVKPNISAIPLNLRKSSASLLHARHIVFCALHKKPRFATTNRSRLLWASTHCVI